MNMDIGQVIHAVIYCRARCRVIVRRTTANESPDDANPGIFSLSLWGSHTTYEETIAKACQAHGATVEYLLCDGFCPNATNTGIQKRILRVPLTYASAARPQQKPAWINLGFLIAGWAPL